MLGPRIAALRREKNMSQAELAKALKISPSAVGMYEQGRREPAGEILVKMAEIFEVTTDYLLTGIPREDDAVLTKILMSRLSAADRLLQNRTNRPFARQELAVLFAAMLIEP